MDEQRFLKVQVVFLKGGRNEKKVKTKVIHKIKWLMRDNNIGPLEKIICSLVFDCRD